MSATSLADDQIAAICESIEQRWREKVKICEQTSIQNQQPYCIGANICLTEESDPAAVLESAVDKEIDNICQKLSANFEKELLTSAVMVFEPMNFINFPVSAILDSDKLLTNAVFNAPFIEIESNENPG
jgi:hypothetical protein